MGAWIWRTLHQSGDTEALERLRVLRESASSRVEREIVELTVDLLGPRPSVALRSLRLLVDEYLPWIERRSVLRARESGTSWAGVARLLGRSRQAVHERFTRQATASDAMPPPPLRRRDPDERERQTSAEQRRRTADADAAGDDGALVPW